jgi:hypothetical protein
MFNLLSTAVTVFFFAVKQGAMDQQSPEAQSTPMHLERFELTTRNLMEIGKNSADNKHYEVHRIYCS